MNRDKNRIMETTREQMILDYCQKTDDDGYPVYYDDILDGKIMIFEIPIEFRTSSAYAYACRSLRGLAPEYRITQIPLLETQLLSDIIEWYSRGYREKAQDLTMIHFTYFNENGKDKKYNFL